MDNLNRQLLDHIKALHGAGVEWLPRTSALEVANQSASPGASAAEQLTSFGPTGDPELSNRRVALTTLAGEVKGCTRCAELCSTRAQTVFGVGNPLAEVCFIGEAHGADEDAKGEPFVGAAGQLLNKILAASGFKREEIYICNILKCRPPGNRTPLAEEAANCRDFLERQLDMIAPKYIVALGGCAATNLLQTTLSIAKLRGRFHVYRDSKLLVTYHPAYLLPNKDPSKKKEVWEDMKFLVNAMGRSLPESSSNTDG